MKLTKPAGVAFQILGFILFLGGLIGMTGSVIGGGLAAILGGWMIYQGGKAARQRKKE